MQGIYWFWFSERGSSINCNDLDAGVRMKLAFLNKKVKTIHFSFFFCFFFPPDVLRCFVWEHARHVASDGLNSENAPLTVITDNHTALFFIVSSNHRTNWHNTELHLHPPFWKSRDAVENIKNNAMTCNVMNPPLLFLSIWFVWHPHPPSQKVIPGQISAAGFVYRSPRPRGCPNHISGPPQLTLWFGGAALL